MFIVKERVEELMKEREISMEKLVKHTGVNEKVMAEYLSGDREVNEEVLKRMSRMLKCAKEYLTGDVERLYYMLRMDPPYIDGYRDHYSWRKRWGKGGSYLGAGLSDDKEDFYMVFTMPAQRDMAFEILKGHGYTGLEKVEVPFD